MTATGDQIAQQMLAMAEYFRQRYEIRRAIKCTLGASKVAHSDCFKILAAHQAGKLYHLYTDQSEQAERFLDLAYRQMLSNHYVEGAQTTMYEVMRQYRLEAACMLCEIHLAEGAYNKVAEFAQNLPDAQSSPTIFARLSFLCAEGAMGERRIGAAYEILDNLRSRHDSPMGTRHICIYAMIAKLHIAAHIMDDLPQKDVEEIKRAIEAVPAEDATKINLQVYFMSVQLANFADTGMARTSKGLIKTLQHHTNVKMYNAGIRWADPTFITALVCVFTQTQMFQNCNKERCTKYYTHAIKTVKDYFERNRTLDSGVERHIRRLRMVAEETMCQTKIIQCELTSAVEMIHEMLQEMNSIPVLQVLGVPRMHLLLGLVSLYNEDPNQAEKHFNAAVASTPPWDRELSQQLAAHRALLYLQQARIAEFYDLDDLIGQHRADGMKQIHMKSMVKFIHGYHAFLQNKLQDCRLRVHEIVELTKAEDMFRMYTMGLLLFSALTYETTDHTATIKTTIEWSIKNSDVSLLAWTFTQLYEISHRQRQPPGDYGTMLMSYFEAIQNGQTALRKHELEHLLKWTTNDVQEILPNNQLLP